MKVDDEEQLIYENIDILWKNRKGFQRKALRQCLDETTDWDKIPSLKSVLKDIGEHKGTIMVICETYTSGKVFKYGNYGDYWTLEGRLKGFA